MSACRTPKMADAVEQAAAGREQPQREVPLVETRQPEVQNTDEEEDDAEEEVSCFKEVEASGDGESDLSRQRDAGVLMADSDGSPTPSVISIRSDLTDAEDEGREEQPLKCRLNE